MFRLYRLRLHLTFTQDHVLYRSIRSSNNTISRLRFNNIFRYTSLTQQRVVISSSNIHLILHRSTNRFTHLTKARMYNHVQLSTVLRRAITRRNTHNFNRHNRFSRQFLNHNLHNLTTKPCTCRRSTFRPSFAMFSFNSILSLTRAHRVLRYITKFTFLPLFIINFTGIFPTINVGRRIKLINRRSPSITYNRTLLSVILLTR